MSPSKSKLSQSSSTVHFSNKGIFHYEGKPFKIFPSKSKNPKGVISPGDENECLKGDYSPLETVLEGVEAPEEKQLKVTGEPI